MGGCFMADRSQTLRTFFARFVATRGGAHDPRIELAFAAVPRENFAGPGPWSVAVPGVGYVRTPDDDPAFLYQDTLIALDAAKGINIGEPSLHARCLDALALRAGERVLHIGAGAGYYTAIIAHLVGAAGHVDAYEIEPTLAERARRNLANYPGIEVHERSGIADDLPKANAIYVNAGSTHPSWAWLDALLTGGRLIFPLQPVGGYGGMLCVERPAEGIAWPARFVSRAGFISLEGRQDAALSRGLAAAFEGHGWKGVRSLRLDEPADTTCWFAGDDWWLSTEEPAEE